MAVCTITVSDKVGADGMQVLDVEFNPRPLPAKQDRTEAQLVAIKMMQFAALCLHGAAEAGLGSVLCNEDVDALDALHGKPTAAGQG